MNLLKITLLFASASLGPCSAAHQTQLTSGETELHRTLQDSLVTADCSVCFEEIDDARDCLRECNNDASNPLNPSGDSLLESCLNQENVQDLEDLAKCCGFTDKGCEDTLKEASLCLVQCMDTCLVANAGFWYICVQRETGHQGCTRQECLDGFLDDLPADWGLEDEVNLFDLENIERRLKKIPVKDMEECSLLGGFVEEACRVGDSCCDACQDALASTLDCLINDVVAPFVAASLNETLPECPVAEDCSTDLFPKRRERSLSEKEADLVNKEVRLPQSSRKEAFLKMVEKQGERQLDEAVSSDPIGDCKAKMETDIITYNMTEAANNYLACVNAAVFAALDDEDSAGVIAMGLRPAALVASMLVVLFL